MPSAEKVLMVVKEWTDKAENDLLAASHLLQLGESGPMELVCFHAQQSVEKYLKAVLVLHGLSVPKTHDIEKLIALIPGQFTMDISIAEMRILTSYGTEARYPGFGVVALEEAKEAVIMAQRIRDQVRSIVRHDSSNTNIK